MSPRARFSTAALAVFVALLGATRGADAQTPPARGAPERSRGGARDGGARFPAAAPEGVVNINAASEQELRRLPGIGPARAEAIVALRQRVQRFRAPDDLMRVRGIGRAGMRRLRPYITLAGDTTLATRPGRARAAHAPSPAPAGEEGAR